MLTRREKRVLFIVLLTIPILALIKQSIINEWELCWLIFYVAPLGFYIATDPERRKAG